MLDQELKRLWQELNGQEVVNIEPTTLVGDLKARVDNMEAAIKKRDRKEIQAALLAVPSFALLGYWNPSTISKIGAFLIIPSALLIIWMIKNVKKHKNVDFSQPLNQYLQKYLYYLKKERQLLRNILYWYILPCLIPAILFVVGFGGLKFSKFFPVAFVVAINIYIYYRNKKSLRTEFNPLIEEMEQMVEKLKNEQEEETKE